MKRFFKRIIVGILTWQVKRLRAKHAVKVVAVAGSIGKTSTKFAIASLLEAKFRVGYQKGNYNDVVTVPLVFFGLPLPSLLNPIAWLVTFIKIEQQLRGAYQYDVVVVEVGTDYPGMIRQFSYLNADIGVLTAITPEHMEFFDTLDAVAAEETTIADFSKQFVVNADLCPAKYLSRRDGVCTYGIDGPADYVVSDIRMTGSKRQFSVRKQQSVVLESSFVGVSHLQLYSVAAAVVVADLLGMEYEAIAKPIPSIQQVPGRLQVLRGLAGSTIIDDTYNASPEAMKFALNALYEANATRRIALLGNMNELGAYSPRAHAEIGTYCDPTKINLVLTLGPDANEYLAPAAEARGCKVIRCDSPFMAAEHIRDMLDGTTVVLAKGSQNKVFAEEAVRQLLADPADSARLVRQGAGWMKIKRAQFKDFVA